MGFYGNITNTTRTQFQFDKVYPNRYEMDKLGWADGVYIGRFVLVEYDDEYHLDTFTRVTMNNGKAYLNGINGVLITKSMIELNDIVYTTSSHLTPDTGLAPKDCVFYKCTSAYSAGSTEPATFIAITQFNGTAYTDNYHIDLNTYGTGRGYDSTVWQKVYTDGREKYVMVAELNSVVPTFAISTDAPTMNPVEPHFDLSSTDVYYKLHWQTPWGFRIGSNDNYSDAQTVWTTTTYNQDTGKNNTTTATKNAAIYFNKAGFNPRIRTKVESAGVDEIKVVPVSSGQKIYNNHNAKRE